MRELTSWQTFLTKYFVTAVWIIGPITTAIIVYNKFGQVDGFYFAPLFLLPAIMSYMPMKISFDEIKIVVSDWLTSKQYRFDDIKSLEFSRPTISYHSYLQLEITTTDNEIKKIKFMPRGSDSIKSMFSKELQGRQKELIEVWTQRTTHNNVYKT
jgi:hypothetical protein